MQREYSPYTHFQSYPVLPDDGQWWAFSRRIIGVFDPPGPGERGGGGRGVTGQF
jgi:hypothetical protein